MSRKKNLYNSRRAHSGLRSKPGILLAYLLLLLYNNDNFLTVYRWTFQAVKRLLWSAFLFIPLLPPR